MGVLSLNGNFSYPIELTKTLTVDEAATFKGSFAQGNGSIATGDRAFSIGDACSSTSRYSVSEGFATSASAPYSHAAGWQSIAASEGSYANGYNSKADEAHDYSFVWQGKQTSNVYHSKGNGTFSINPNGVGANLHKPEYGFFIGDYDFPYYISSYAKDTILPNNNIFTGTDTFTVLLSSNAQVSFSSILDVSAKSTFTGEIHVPDIDIKQSPDDLAATTQYARSIATSAIMNVGVRSEDVADRFSLIDEQAASCGYLSSYVLSCANNVDEFVGDSSLSSIASKGYSLNLATSASTNLLSTNNTFLGTNAFDNDVTINRGKLSLTYNSEADFTNGILRIKNQNLTQNDESIYIPATTAFARSIATSGVNWILSTGVSYRGNNTYLGNSVYTGTVAMNGITTFSNDVNISRGTTKLSQTATADFSNGTLLIKNPSVTTNLANTPASTQFVRSVATSGMVALLNSDDTFNGNLVFNGSTTFKKSVYFTTAGAELFVKTKSLNENPSTEAASTEYVANRINQTVETSSISVKKLICDTDETVNSTYKFNGNVTFGNDVYATSKGLFLRNQSITERPSSQAASTQYVNDLLTNTISTSSESVKGLICNGSNSYVGNNVYRGTSDFTAGTSKVKTMPRGDSSANAASTEFVTAAINSINTNPFDLFDTKWSDYTLPSSSQWKESGSTVNSSAVYNHILSDYNSGTAKTETISGKLIVCRVAADGHKIVHVSNRAAVDQLYSATGVAWYYIIDTTNMSVVLPRTKYGFDGWRSEVGGYIAPGIPSHTHTVYVGRSADSGHGSKNYNMHHGGDSTCSSQTCTTTAPSNSIYGASSTVQPPATQMFLYFYCG